MKEIEHEDVKSRKKRPERQLYVPPAQRRSSLKESNNVKNKPKHKSCSVNKREKVPEIKSHDNENKIIKTNNNVEPHQYKSEHQQIPNNTSNENKSIFEYLLCSYFIQLRWKCLILGSQLKFEKGYDFRHFQNEHFLLQIPLVLFYSYNSSYLHQVKLGNYQNKYFYNNAFPFYNMKTEFQYTNFNNDLEKTPVIVPDMYNNLYYSNVLKQFHIFCNYDIYKVDNILFIDNSYKCFPYIHLTLEGCLLEKQNACIFDTTDNISDTLNSTSNLSNKDNASASETVPINKMQDTRHVNNKTESLKTTSDKSLRNKKNQEKTDHEEELEIMKKTKEHINRKTRPIMKYVGESNDTLKIEDESLKSWEDLFDDEGEIKEDLLNVDKKIKKIKQKSNLNRNSSDYITEDLKHVEELEHMVELYDFPSSFKTQDLIQAFSDINCEAMYIKWVDDTHAILVLGTLTQALKAASTNNPLIKVRPMAAASRITLEIATKNELKPAMKRPATNLQAARRFITAALGTKIGVSRERMAKEREDLKAAREMKKLMKKNERDAWEGSLQSSLQS